MSCCVLLCLDGRLAIVRLISSSLRHFIFCLLGSYFRAAGVACVTFLVPKENRMDCFEHDFLSDRHAIFGVNMHLIRVLLRDVGLDASLWSGLTMWSFECSLVPFIWSLFDPRAVAVASLTWVPCCPPRWLPCCIPLQFILCGAWLVIRGRCTWSLVSVKDFSPFTLCLACG